MFSLDRWLGRRQDPVLGIDIGAGGIHLVELGGPGWPLRVRHAGYAPLPHGALRDGSIVMPEAAADALRRALRASGTRLRDAALALSARSVMKKVVSLPEPAHEDDLEDEVDAEAGANLPFERAEVGIDFAVLGPTAGQDGFIDVMLVAARKEKIDERVALAVSAGLRPRIVDIESHAVVAAIGLAEAARATAAPQPVAVLQVDAERSHCLFMLGGELLFERELATPAARHDADPVEQIGIEFERVSQMFRASTSLPDIAHLYLFGALPPGLPAALARRSGLGVTVPDPLLDITGGLERIAPGEQAQASACLLACGLALRSFDR
jgi:type IV pilus assembly protein PilM